MAKNDKKTVKQSGVVEQKGHPQSVKAPSASNQVQKTYPRDWLKVRSAWLAYPPKSTPGTVLSSELSEFVGLSDVAKNCRAAFEKQVHDYRQPFTGIHAEVAEHGLLYLAKAANVVGCCEVQNATHPTWSLSIGYQAALLGLEGVLRLLGLCTVEVNNITLIIDLWAGPPENMSNKLKSSYELGEMPKFLWCGKIEHYHRWALLQRTLRVLSSSPIPKEISAAICSMEDKKFARQRNDLHYRVNWPFNDLLGHVSKPDLPTFTDLEALQNSLSPQDPRFGIALAFAVLSIGLLILADLAKISAAYDGHYQAILSTLNASQHPFFQTFYPLL